MACLCSTMLVTSAGESGQRGKLSGSVYAGVGCDPS